MEKLDKAELETQELEKREKIKKKTDTTQQEEEY